MVDIAVHKPIYRLGRVSFVVKGSDVTFERELEGLLPRADSAALAVDEVCTDDVRELISNVLARHSGYLWIDAACLLSPQGHKVLIAGHSGAGKSTTALALALGYGWKVFAEDLTLIDMETNSILVFASPFSLKAGTLGLLRESIAPLPDSVVLGEWVPMKSMQAQSECGSNFDLSLFFGKARHGEPMQEAACNPGEYVRLLLSCSSLMHDERAPDKLAEYVSAGPCYRVQGGSLLERLEFILGLTSKVLPVGVRIDDKNTVEETP